MAKTAPKSFSLSNSSQKSPFYEKSQFWSMLCTATPEISSSSENVNSTVFPDYLSFSYDCGEMWLTELTTLLYLFCWFLIQIRNILQWVVVSTMRYRKGDNWMIGTVYSELKVGNLL